LVNTESCLVLRLQSRLICTGSKHPCTDPCDVTCKSPLVFRASHRTTPRRDACHTGSSVCPCQTGQAGSAGRLECSGRPWHSDQGLPVSLQPRHGIFTPRNAVCRLCWWYAKVIDRLVHQTLSDQTSILLPSSEVPLSLCTDSFMGHAYTARVAPRRVARTKHRAAHLWGKPARSVFRIPM